MPFLSTSLFFLLFFGSSTQGKFVQREAFSMTQQIDTFENGLHTSEGTKDYTENKTFLEKSKSLCLFGNLHRNYPLQAVLRGVQSAPKGISLLYRVE